MVRPSFCAVCQRKIASDPEAARWIPFCSERCRQVDFVRWSEGRYAITEPVSPDEWPELVQEFEGVPDAASSPVNQPQRGEPLSD